MEKEWTLIKERKGGYKVYRHKILHYIAETLKNGNFLVYRDTYNPYQRYTSELSYTETINFYHSYHS